MNIAEEIKKATVSLRDDSPIASLLKPPPTPTLQGKFTGDVRATFNADDGSAVFTTTITDIQEPVAAVGFTGVLPPGCFAIVVPASRRQRLAEFLAVGIPDQQWFGVPQLGLPGTAGNPGADIVGLPPEALVLYPGDVCALGRVSTEGVAVFVSASRWGWNYGNTATNVNFRYRPEAYLRIFRTLEALPSNIGFVPIPSWTRGTAQNSPVAASGNDALPTIRIPPGCTHVRLVFQDNVDSITPVQGAETGTYEVWWQDISGIWMHHGDDDFDAAGRGAVDANHNSEVYSIHPGMIGVLVVRTAGDVFFYNMLAFNAYGTRW